MNELVSDISGKVELNVPLAVSEDKDGSLGAFSKVDGSSLFWKLSEPFFDSRMHLLDTLNALLSVNVDGTELHLSLGISIELVVNKDG
jgi:hypothetical protein